MPIAQNIIVEIEETQPISVNVTNLTPIVVQVHEGGQGGGGVQSVLGSLVDNTDPANPIVNTPTFNEVLTEGNETDGEDILISDGDAIVLDNGSLLKKGTYDFGAGGGISQICSVNYEDNWQAGIRHVFDNNGFIRHSTNCFNIIPDASFDNTLRFKVDSLWTLDDGTTYICNDATTGAAVWVIYNPNAQVNSDWNATSGVEEILNKPTIPTLTSELSNDSGFITASGAPIQSVTGTAVSGTASNPIINLQDLSSLQSKAVVVSSNQTAVLDGVYNNVATATYTDPTPTEGKGFVVFVRNGTATIGGTAYSTAGSTIWRVFHSGAWANYVNQLALTDVNFGAFVNGLTSKTTPVDADSFSINDSAASNVQKKLSFTNLKAFLKTYFDTLYVYSRAQILAILGITELYITTGDQTTTSGTAVNITGLSMSLAANKRYFIQGKIFMFGVTGGTRFTITIPTAATIKVSNFGRTNSSTGFVNTFIQASGLPSSTYSSSAADGFIELSGEITTGVNAGTLNIAFFSVTGGNLSTIYQQGTFIEVKDV